MIPQMAASYAGQQYNSTESGLGVGAAMAGAAGLTGIAGGLAFSSRFRNLAKNYVGSNIHKAGMRWGLEGYGIGKGMSKLGRVAGGAFALYEGWQGYKKGGLAGAARGLATGFATTYALRVGLGLMANPYVAAGVAVAAVAGAGLYARKAAIDKFGAYHRRQVGLELGAPISDSFGTVSTMRQRSLQAINNSRVNGRVALGNEAGLNYVPYSVFR